MSLDHYFRKSTSLQAMCKPNRYKTLLMFLWVLLLAACTPPKAVPLAKIPGPRGTLTIEISGFRSLKGEVLISLFQETLGFPEHSEQALINFSTPVLSGRQHFEFPPLPWGRYSYSILHDENGNGTMDRTLLGSPREGYAFSNDLEGHFGQPEAEKALFTIGAEPQNHHLRIHYFKRKGNGPFSK